MSAEAAPAGDWHAELCALLAVTISRDLLERSLTHRSYAYENGGLPTNERLEFLGDSVLGLVVTDTLYRSHPELPEGQLAKLRAAVVNMRALADVGRELDWAPTSGSAAARRPPAVGTSPRSSPTPSRRCSARSTSTAASSAAAGLVHRLFDPLIEQAATLGAGLDWKTSLQELTATASLGVPEYLVTETGPDHEKVFTAVARVVRRGLRTGQRPQQEGGRAAGRRDRLAATAR